MERNENENTNGELKIDKEGKFMIEIGGVRPTLEQMNLKEPVKPEVLREQLMPLNDVLGHASSLTQLTKSGTRKIKQGAKELICSAYGRLEDLHEGNYQTIYEELKHEKREVTAAKKAGMEIDEVKARRAVLNAIKYQLDLHSAADYLDVRGQYSNQNGELSFDLLKRKSRLVKVEKFQNHEVNIYQVASKPKEEKLKVSTAEELAQEIELQIAAATPANPFSKEKHKFTQTAKDEARGVYENARILAGHDYALMSDALKIVYKDMKASYGGQISEETKGALSMVRSIRGLNNWDKSLDFLRAVTGDASLDGISACKAAKEVKEMESVLNASGVSVNKEKEATAFRQTLLQEAKYLDQETSVLLYGSTLQEVGQINPEMMVNEVIAQETGLDTDDFTAQALMEEDERLRVVLAEQMLEAHTKKHSVLKEKMRRILASPQFDTAWRGAAALVTLVTSLGLAGYIFLKNREDPVVEEVRVVATSQAELEKTMKIDGPNMYHAYTFPKKPEEAEKPQDIPKEAKPEPTSTPPPPMFEVVYNKSPQEEIAVKRIWDALGKDLLQVVIPVKENHGGQENKDGYFQAKVVEVPLGKTKEGDIIFDSKNDVLNNNYGFYSTGRVLDANGKTVSQEGDFVGIGHNKEHYWNYDLSVSLEGLNVGDEISFFINPNQKVKYVVRHVDHIDGDKTTMGEILAMHKEGMGKRLKLIGCGKGDPGLNNSGKPRVIVDAVLIIDGDDQMAQGMGPQIAMR